MSEEQKNFYRLKFMEELGEERMAQIMREVAEKDLFWWLWGFYVKVSKKQL